MNLLKLINGDVIRADTVTAIRKGDARAKGPNDWEYELKPRVIVDFTCGDHGNCVVIDCESDKERDDIVAELVKKWEGS